MLPRLDRPVIVEGKYDRLRLLCVVDATVLTTDGFGVFRSDEKKQLIRTLAARRGVLVLTDADGAGLVIRNFLRGILPPEQITHLYIPPIPGTEKRKKTPSRAGLLGVEGMEKEVLLGILQPYICGSSAQKRGGITKTDLFCDGLTGAPGSRQKRAALARALSLPENLSTNALLEAVNLLIGIEQYRQIVGTSGEETDSQKGSTPL